MDIGEKNKLNENLIKSSKIASKIACKTKIYASKRKGSGSYFTKMEHAIKAYELHEVDLHANIWLRWFGFIENAGEIQETIEIRIHLSGKSKKIFKY